MSLIMDHPAWPPCILQPSGHSQVCLHSLPMLTTSVLPSFTLLPQLLSPLPFLQVSSSSPHPMCLSSCSHCLFFCYYPVFSCLCKLRCLLLDVLSLLPQRRLPATCLLVTSLLPSWCFHSCCPCKAVSSMAVTTSHSFLSPEPLSQCLAQRGTQESCTKSVSCPRQIRAGYRRYREKTYPNNKGLKI